MVDEVGGERYPIIKSVFCNGNINSSHGQKSLTAINRILTVVSTSFTEQIEINFLFSHPEYGSYHWEVFRDTEEEEESEIVL